MNVKNWPKICHLGPSKFSLSWCQKQEKLDSTRLKLVVLHYTFVICISSEHIILIIIYSFKTGTVMDFGIIKPVLKISRLTNSRRCTFQMPVRRTGFQQVLPNSSTSTLFMLTVPVHRFIIHYIINDMVVQTVYEIFTLLYIIR